MKKHATKRRDYIAPCDMTKTRNFINVMDFPGLIQIGWFSSRNIKILWEKDSVGCCACLPSILYFTCFELFLCLFYSYPIDQPLSQSLCMICLKFWTCIVFVDYLNACDDIPARQLNYNNHLHAYNRLLNMGMIWYNPPPRGGWGGGGGGVGV